MTQQLAMQWLGYLQYGRVWKLLECLPHGGAKVFGRCPFHGQFPVAYGTT